MFYVDGSIVVKPTTCDMANGAFVGIDLLDNERVDVLFGPTCAAGI